MEQKKQPLEAIVRPSKPFNKKEFIKAAENMAKVLEKEKKQNAEQQHA